MWLYGFIHNIFVQIIQRGVVKLVVVKEFIDAFFNGLKDTTITIFDEYSFTLYELCITCAVVTILAYCIWKYFND